jgi:D-alanyl-D-alanine carboxypeptidase (penicillin-binding protein 5/6)
MVALLEQLDEGKLASESATKAMKKHLSMCEDKRLSKLLPPEVKVLQKTGSVSAVRTVAGIFEFPSGHVAICLLTSQNKDTRWKADNAGEVLAHNIGRVLFEHYQPSGLAGADEPDKVLKVGSQGARVEQLQQALNKQLSPSPDLNPDGEFGPITKTAVIAWQKANKLPETGEIDRAAWQKLGLAEEGYRPR